MENDDEDEEDDEDEASEVSSEGSEVRFVTNIMISLPLQDLGLAIIQLLQEANQFLLLKRPPSFRSLNSSPTNEDASLQMN